VKPEMYWEQIIAIAEIDNEQLITEQLSSLFKEWQAQNKIIHDMPQVAA
jgi:hypothetical protein